MEERPEIADLFGKPTGWKQPAIINGVRQDATGFVDRELSARHRLWGRALYAIDVDSWPGVFIEHHKGRPSAVVEWKAANSRIRRNQVLVLVDAVRPGIPVLVVRYCKHPWEFQVIPANQAAAQATGTADAVLMSEHHFVAFLARLRGLDTIDPDVDLDRGITSRLGPAEWL